MLRSPFWKFLLKLWDASISAEYMIDRKGITDRVTLNGMTLMNWKVYNLPMDKKYIFELRSSGRTLNKPGIFFRGNFFLEKTGDTFL